MDLAWRTVIWSHQHVSHAAFSTQNKSAYGYHNSDSDESNSGTSSQSQTLTNKITEVVNRDSAI